jgi:hypothetical protein
MNCKKPFQFAGLNINGEIFKYGVTFQFCDAGDTTTLPESQIFIKITGRDANSIYDFNGNKSFLSLRGIMNVGLDPRITPSSANPISFTLEVYGPNYLPVKIPVIIDGSLKQQRVLVTLVNLKKPPKGVSVFQFSNLGVNAQGGLSSTQILSSLITSSTPENVTITIPAGTKFLDADGNVIIPQSAADSLSGTIVFYSTHTAYSMNSFPGGSVMSDSIITPNGKISGFHQSAGMSYIEMSLGGKDVKSFTSPVIYDITMDPNYISASTNAPVAPGEILSVMNFDYEKNRWDYISDDTLKYIGGTLRGRFSITKLKFNSLSWITPRCTQTTSLIIKNNIFIGTSYLIDIYNQLGDKRHPLIAGLFVEIPSTGSVIKNIPLPDCPVEIRVYENCLDNGQYNYYVRRRPPVAVFTGSTCGNNLVINVNNPPDLQWHYFNVIGYCSNKYYYVFPTIPTFYKFEDDRVNYALLGTVHLGQFTTTNLRMSTHYHFAWISGIDLFTKEKLLDSSSFVRGIPVPEVYPGDTLRNMWCY